MKEDFPSNEVQFVTTGFNQSKPALSIFYNFVGRRGSDAPAATTINIGQVPEGFISTVTANINNQ